MKRLLVIALCLGMLLAGCAGQTEHPDTSEKLPVDQAAREEIRRALGMLIDRDYVANSIGQAGQTPADGFVPMGMEDYYRGGYYAADRDSYRENFANAIRQLGLFFSVMQVPETE